MKILYAASEAAPFIKTGGLADVAGSLPKALNKIGQDCRVVIPLYGQIGPEFRENMEKVCDFWIDLGWKHEYCGVYETKYDGVIYYFLENDYYFRRDRLYGELDDAERFIFFSKGVTRLPKVLDFEVDIINANDWHTGLVPVFVNDYRTGDPFYKNVRTVLTIHNLKYQGQFSPDTFYWTNLAGYYMSDYDLKFYDSINFLKGGIVHANAVNTVSKTYAEEIRYPFFGEGLDAVIRSYSEKLRGIINGLDYDVWNPETDKFLKKNYSLKTVEDKVKSKLEIQKLYGLPERPDVPLFVMISRLTAMKGMDLVRFILEEFLEEDVQFVVLGTGDREYEEMFSYFAWTHPKKCAAKLYYSNEESHKLYAAADVFVMPSVSEPCGLSQMIAMRYGAVPIVREAGGLKDSVEPFDRYKKTGCGLTFANINAHELLFKLKEAAALYRDEPELYRMLQKNGMELRLDWEASSREYLEMYESLF